MCCFFLIGRPCNRKTGLRGLQCAHSVEQFKTISNGDSIIRPISYKKKCFFAHLHHSSIDSFTFSLQKWCLKNQSVCKSFALRYAEQSASFCPNSQMPTNSKLLVYMNNKTNQFQYCDVPRRSRLKHHYLQDVKFSFLSVKVPFVTPKKKTHYSFPFN